MGEDRSSDIGPTSPRQRRSSSRPVTRSRGRSRAPTPPASRTSRSKSPVERQSEHVSEEHTSASPPETKNKEVVHEAKKYNTTTFVVVACVVFLLATVSVWFLSHEIVNYADLFASYKTKMVHAFGVAWTRVWS